MPRPGKSPKKSARKKADRRNPTKERSRSNAIKGLLTRGLKQFRAGRLPEAGRTFEKIVARQPDLAEAHHGLGLVALHAGEALPACEHFLRAIGIRPDHPLYFNHLGLALRDRREMEQALAAFEMAITLEPGFTEAHINLGNTLLQIDRPEQALTSFQLAFTQQIGNARIHHGMGRALLRLNRLPEAVRSLTTAVTLQPRFPSAHFDLGNAHTRQGDLPAALGHFQRTLEQQPDHIDAHIATGAVLHELKRLEEAAAGYRAALALQPDNTKVHINLGNVLRDSGDLDAALAQQRMALELDPDNALASFNLGVVLQDQGRLDAAMRAIRQALNKDPRLAVAHRQLANHKTHRHVDDEVRAMAALLADPATPDADRMHLAFGLGKAYEELQRYEEAFDCFQTGNTLRRREFHFDIEAETRRFAAWREFFSRERFQRFADVGVNDATPVFILGMPRSGSTLVEQILASHPQVTGGGELTLLRDTLNDHCRQLGSPPGPPCLHRLTGGDFQRIGGDYLAGLRRLATDARRITDKLPINFIHIGLIRLVLPGATILHCRRDPLDTCLSIYKNYFTDSQPFAYDLEELGRYHRLYETLMDHWHRLLPGFVHDIHYEELVADPEARTRRLLALCGLPWDETCLRFHQTDRVVKTASFAQVRKPIHRDSIQRWKRYEQPLQPLVKILRQPPAGE